MNRLQQSARESFDNHPQRIKTLDFALAAVYFSDLRRGTDKRGLSIRDRVYLLGEHGYLPLTLSPLRSSLNERLPLEGDPPLQHYPSSEEDFVEQTQRNERTAAFVAMDAPSLEILFRNDSFDEGYLGSHMGIDKRYVA